MYCNSITLEWSDNAANETALRFCGPPPRVEAATKLNAQANTRSYTDAGRAANTTYYYRIQAVNGLIAGEPLTQVKYARPFASATALPLPVLRL